MIRKTLLYLLLFVMWVNLFGDYTGLLFHELSHCFSNHLSDHVDHHPKKAIKTCELHKKHAHVHDGEAHSHNTVITLLLQLVDTNLNHPDGNDKFLNLLMMTIHAFVTEVDQLNHFTLSHLRSLPNQYVQLVGILDLDILTPPPKLFFIK